MLALKIITASVLVASLVFRSVMDFFWRDKRTLRHRYARNAFLCTAIGAALLNGGVLWFEELQKRSNAAEQQERTTDIGNLSGGALTPSILVELYTGPTFPTPPRFTVNPKFPGFVAIWMENTNSFPIYDVEAYLWHDKGTNRIESEIAKKFNAGSTNMAIMKIGGGPVQLLPGDLELPRTKFTFYVRTRRGTTRHEWTFELISNKWEYANVVADLTYRTNRILLSEVSSNFPKHSLSIP